MVKFSQDLWDSFDAIAAKTETSANVAKNLIDFLTERAKIEQAYAKSLAELSKKAGGGGGLFASKNDVVDKEAKSVKTVVLSLREETLHISNTHQEFSAKILSEVVRPVEGFLKSKDLDRKKNIQEGQKRLKAQADAKAAHDRAKDAYNKAGKESDAASEAHEKAQKDLFADAENKKLKENEKRAAQKVQPAADKLKAAEAAYQKSVDAVNDIQAKTFTEYLPPVLDFLQQFEEDKFAVFRQVLSDFLRLQKAVPDQVNTFSLEIAKQIDGLDLEGDLDEFVKANAKDKTEPTPYTFVGYKDTDANAAGPSGSSSSAPKKEEPEKKGKEAETETTTTTETKKEDELFEG
eukprot:TRINITY_DN2066_c0_g1_i3.p1 TRINITY_DN2066_c0_g1~~TRINITY_DN2066_c0_g1_i3.p1  ORF type:complete len:349 (-),score=117.30 TRINITY_DN2066_c0_g1_i3:137-1183(-)